MEILAVESELLHVDAKMDGQTPQLRSYYLHGCTVYQQYQIFYCPTNTLNYINCRIIKNTLKL